MKVLFHEKRIIYALLCVGCAAISFNVAAIAAVIPSISADLNFPSIAVANIIPYYMIPYGIGALFYAPLTQTISYRYLLGLPLLLFGFFSFLCGSIHSLPLFYLGRTGMGITGASVIPLGLLIISQFFESERRGRLIGIFFSLSFFASVAGIVLTAMASWRWLFYIPAIVSVIAAGMFALLPKGTIDKKHGTKVDYLKSFLEKSVRDVFIFIFFISFLYHGVHQWFGVYLAKEYHLDKILISVFFIVMSLSGAFGQILGGVLTDTKGRSRTCLIGILVLSISTMLLAGRYNLFVLCLLMGLVDLGWTIGHNGISTVLTDFPQAHRPQTASLNSALRFISGGMGISASSLIVEKSFSLAFFSLGLLMLGLSLFLKKVVFRDP